ncbi:methyltransferase domain-containing protein [Acetobacterium paludosum]|uniref:Methyltransferase domain-containing protein n=1 Tax=Acetobacterium paludosum TaxID=52693 RepID=A0A923HXR1_9FIRM|nr:class I SAM-dependent methyltransferase [Acetobacterium paludosum]MBC3889077.1 methyltransferase domain-containing protein [Acetobacterium paludosum]
MNNMIQAVEERWDVNAQKYDNRHQVNTTPEDKKHWMEALAENIGPDKNIKLMDVGAGTGFITLMAAELGYQCHAVDISSGMLEVARNHANNKGLRIDFIKSNVENIPCEDASMDVIVNRHVMWTLLNPGEACKEWFRVLKNGGKLLCIVTIGSMGDSCNHYSQDIEDQLPLKGADENKLINTLIEAGFSNVEAIKLDKIRNMNEDKAWYIIKGIKGVTTQALLERIENRWNVNAGNYNENHGKNEDIEQWTTEIKTLLGDDLTKKVLDVGTGTGFASMIEASIGYQTTGLDLSVGMLDYAKQDAKARNLSIDFVKSSVETIPFTDESFDIITNKSLMWTLTEPLKAVTEWKRLLVIGGKLFCIVHIKEGPVHSSHYEQDIENSLPLKGAPVSAFMELIKTAGFSNVEGIPLMNLPPMHGEDATESNCWYVFKGEK